MLSACLTFATKENFKVHKHARNLVNYRIVSQNKSSFVTAGKILCIYILVALYPGDYL